VISNQILGCTAVDALSDTGLERWGRFGLLRAAGYNYGEIAELTGIATGEIGAEIKRSETSSATTHRLGSTGVRTRLHFRHPWHT
jgi:hypothetical protein